MTKQTAQESPQLVTFAEKKTKTPTQEAAHTRRFKNNRKEKYYKQTYLVLDDNYKHLVTANIYCTPQGHISCCFWVHGDDWAHGNIGYRSGSGHVGVNSGGFHKASAALADAIYDAGISLSQDISGMGSNYMEEALLVIAQHAQRHGNKKLKLIKTNG